MTDVSYELLTDADELTMVTNRLSDLEHQHYQAALNQLAQPDTTINSNPPLESLAKSVLALQAKYNELKAAAPAAK